MKRGIFLRVTFCILAAAMAGAGMAEERSDIGRQEYRSHCENCHGPKGDGNGPYASLLTQRAADLTRLSRANQGVFPFARIYESIDGRAEIKGHGSRDMPIWGRTYSVQAAERFFGVEYDQERYVRGRVLALIEYLSTLQKP